MHENHARARGKERLWPYDRHSTRVELLLIEKHGRGVVMVIAVEEYERLTVGLTTKRETAGRGAEAARK